MLKKYAVIAAASTGLAIVTALSLTTPSFAEKTVMVGGAD